MTKKILFIVFFIAVIMYPKDSIGYGYKKNEDPLITVFKSVIFQGRKNNWTRVESEINSIKDRIDDVKDLCDVRLMPKFDAGLAQRNFQEVIKTMANLVFLSIREKFYWNLTEDLQVFTRAKVRLRLAEEYYTLLLSGNVRKYDKHKNTNFHDEIFNSFMKAKKALGSIGFLGAGAVSPNPKQFELITREIEDKLLLVFPYFERGNQHIDILN